MSILDEEVRSADEFGCDYDGWECKVVNQ